MAALLRVCVAVSALGRHLNKVLEVNPDAAYAIVELGVSYFDPHN